MTITAAVLPERGRREEQTVRWSVAVVAAFTFSATLLFFAPAQVYFTNAREFPYLFRWISPVLVVATLTGTLLVTTVALAGGRQFRTVIVGILVGGGWLFWAQGNILVWNFGLLDGHTIDWTTFTGRRVTEYLVWCAGLAGALLFARMLVRRANLLCGVLLGIQTVGLAQSVSGAPAPDPSQVYSVSLEEQFALSSDRNVVIIVLDMFQSDVFGELVRADPRLAGEFDGFVSFRNTVGGFGATFASLTFMLTGQLFDNSAPLATFIEHAFLSDSSLPRELKRAGFDVSLHTTAPQYVFIDPRAVSNLQPKQQITWRHVGRLLDLAAFRYVPHDGKRAVFNDNSWWLQRLAPDTPIRSARPARFSGKHSASFADADLSRFEANHIVEPRWVAELEQQTRVEQTRPAMRLYHLRGPHYPLRMNEQLQFEEMPDDHIGYARQARGSLEAVGLFLQRLKEIGAYDNSLIIVAGDHGYRGPIDGMVLGVHAPADRACSETTAHPDFVHANQKGSALPLLLVKRFGDRKPLRVSDAAVSLGDLPTTIFGELGIAASTNGRSVFEVSDPLRPRRFMQDAMIPARPDGYYPTLREYEIRGPAWCDASWRLKRLISPPAN